MSSILSGGFPTVSQSKQASADGETLHHDTGRGSSTICPNEMLENSGDCRAHDEEQNRAKVRTSALV